MAANSKKINDIFFILDRLFSKDKKFLEKVRKFGLNEFQFLHTHLFFGISFPTLKSLLLLLFNGILPAISH